MAQFFVQMLMQKREDLADYSGMRNQLLIESVLASGEISHTESH